MRAELRALLPTGVAGAERLGASDPEPMFPEESACVTRAVDKRKREFALGRACAREALLGIGVPPQPLVQLADRAVRWPAGCVGSITHADGYVAAIAAPLDVALGLGIDAEASARVRRPLWSQIAGPGERAWLEEACDEHEAGRRATRLFSAKEAFYKAQYCLSRAWVGFHEVGLTFTDTTFEVTLEVDVPGLAPRGARYTGRYLELDGHVVTTLAILTLPR